MPTPAVRPDAPPPDDPSVEARSTAPAAEPEPSLPVGEPVGPLLAGVGASGGKTADGPCAPAASGEGAVGAPVPTTDGTDAAASAAGAAVVDVVTELPPTTSASSLELAAGAAVVDVVTEPAEGSDAPPPAPEAAAEVPVTPPDETGPRPIAPPLPTAGRFGLAPPPERWDDWSEAEGGAPAGATKPAGPLPQTARRYVLVPTALGGESPCGLLAYVDSETLQVRKFTGNPYHPVSSGHVDARAAALLAAVNDPDRLRRPLRRVAGRGDGFWEEVTWEEALTDIAAQLNGALSADPPGAIALAADAEAESDLLAGTLLRTWGIDARLAPQRRGEAALALGSALWSGRPAYRADLDGTQFCLLLGGDLDPGLARRLAAARARGARIALLDPLRSNAAALAECWLPAWPGSETAVLLAVARILLDESRFNREFLHEHVNWEECLRELPAAPAAPTESASTDEAAPEGFDAFVARLRERYAHFTPQYAEAESGVPAADVVRLAHEIAAAGPAFASVCAGGAAAGSLGGWQTVRALLLLHVLTGSIGSVGGIAFTATTEPGEPADPAARPPRHWNDLLWPPEFPLAGQDVGYLLPHRLRAGQERLAALITRGVNPIGVGPDGFAWIEALRDETRIGLHVALTTHWHETAWFADYILPVGGPAESHALHAGRVGASRYLALSQPVIPQALARLGHAAADTAEASPDALADAAAFWLELTWRVDPDGALGLRALVESSEQPGRRATVAERLRRVLVQAAPDFAATAAAYGLTPLDYLRRFGVYVEAPALDADPAWPPTVSPADPARVAAEPAPSVEPPGSVAEAPPDGPSAAPPPESHLLAAGAAAQAGKVVAPEGPPVEAHLSAAGSGGATPTAGGGDDSDVMAPPAETRPPAPPDADTPAPAEPTDTGAGAEATEAPPEPTGGRVDSPGRDVGPASAGGSPATPSGRLELFSATLARWGWPEHALPGYIPGHVGRHAVQRARGEFALVPTLETPPLTGRPPGNAKWLAQLVHSNPLWLNPADAEKLGVVTADPVRVRTEIGFFVTRAWLTEAIRPGVAGISCLLGRWRLQALAGNDRWSSALTDLRGPGLGGPPAGPALGGARDRLMGEGGIWLLRPLQPVEPFESDDPDSARLWWRDAGVPCALALAVHPDPVSGQQAWCQKVTVEPAREGDLPGLVEVNAAQAALVYRDWLALARPAPGPDGLRRPPWLPRPGNPPVELYHLPVPPAAPEPPAPSVPEAPNVEAVTEPTTDRNRVQLAEAILRPGVEAVTEPTEVHAPAAQAAEDATGAASSGSEVLTAAPGDTPAEAADPQS